MIHKDISDEMVRMVMGKMKYLLETITVKEFVSHRPLTRKWPEIASVDASQWSKLKVLDLYSYDAFVESVIRHRIHEEDIIDDFGITDFWDNHTKGIVNT